MGVPLHCDGQSSVSHQSDSVFELAIKGDATALNQLFAPCLPQLRRAAACLLDNPYDREDALQNGLLSALRHLSKFEGRAKFSTWMQAIVMNAAKSILRKQRRQPITFSLDGAHPEDECLCLSDMLSDPRAGLEEEYGQLERSRILDAILQELPPSLRSVVWLCDVEGLCMKEAAECLGLSVPAVKTRHLQAKRLILKVAKEVCPPAPNLGNAYQWRLGCSHQYAHSGAAASSRFSLGDSGGGKWLYDSHKKHVGVERENSHHF
jgi:RNA polymerase sigma-70 factor (ECF subfamily)